MELEIIIGNDYLWYFQNPSVPVNLELSGCKLLDTKLGWVTSGFIKGKQHVPENSHSFFSHDVVTKEATPLELERLSWKLKNKGNKNSIQNHGKNKVKAVSSSVDVMLAGPLHPGINSLIDSSAPSSPRKNQKKSYQFTYETLAGPLHPGTYSSASSWQQTQGPG